MTTEDSRHNNQVSIVYVIKSYELIIRKLKAIINYQDKSVF